MFGIRTFTLILSSFLLFSTVDTGYSPASEMQFLLFGSVHSADCGRIKPKTDAFRENGWPITYIDADREVELVRRFQIQTLPTFIMLLDDREFDRIVGESDPNVMQQRIVEMDKKGREYLKRNGSGRYTQTAPSNVTSPAVPSHAEGNVPKNPQLSAYLSASVRIRVNDPTGLSTGTGTIIDTRDGEALILTCAHIFREIRGEGPVDLDLFLESGTVRVQGKCVDYDLENDLAFVKFTVPPNTLIRAVPLATQDTLFAGQNLISVGCDGGAEPTIRQHRIISLDRCSHSQNLFHYIQVSGAPTLGRSGGGLFSDDGHLVGVCNTGDPNSNDGHFVPHSVVRSQMDRLGFTVVYQSPSLSSQPSRSSQASQTPVQQAAAPEISLVSLNGPATDKPNVSDANLSLTPEERATIEEVRRRQAEGAEVILIVNHPLKKGEEKPQMELIKLENVSEKFLDILLERGNTSTASAEPGNQLPAMTPTLTEQAAAMNRRPIAAPEEKISRQRETGLRTQKTAM